MRFRKLQTWLRAWWLHVVVSKFLDDGDLWNNLEAQRSGQHPSGSAGSICLGQCTSCLRPVRSLMVTVSLMIMTAWLVLDLTYADGLVPGTKESFVIGSAPYDGTSAALKWHEQPTGDESYSCTCSYSRSTSGEYAWGGPVAILVPNLDGRVPSVTELWGLCNTTLPDPANTTDPRYNLDYDMAALQFVFEITQLRVAPPVTAALLTKPAWVAARLIESIRKWHR